MIRGPPPTRPTRVELSPCFISGGTPRGPPHLVGTRIVERPGGAGKALEECSALLLLGGTRYRLYAGLNSRHHQEKH